MTRQNEQAMEDKVQRQALALYRALEGGLDADIQATGHELLGISFKCNPQDVLCTMRLANHKGNVVSFVGSDSMVNAILKAQREARGGKLRFREDRFA